MNISCIDCPFRYPHYKSCIIILSQSLLYINQYLLVGNAYSLKGCYCSLYSWVWNFNSHIFLLLCGILWVQGLYNYIIIVIPIIVTEQNKNKMLRLAQRDTTATRKFGIHVFVEVAHIFHKNRGRTPICNNSLYLVVRKFILKFDMNRTNRTWVTRPTRFG